ncbi:hypothetical protein SDC9_171977 [bioreactor metagenome]|uniref:Uncharacterized protein n=1 Tax=bioreactor metagenome TaxID=1076179 RepID=A0A645GCE2_9ZZZZ
MAIRSIDSPCVKRSAAARLFPALKSAKPESAYCVVSNRSIMRARLLDMSSWEKKSDPCSEKSISATTHNWQSSFRSNVWTGGNGKIRCVCWAAKPIGSRCRTMRSSTPRRGDCRMFFRKSPIFIRKKAPLKRKISISHTKAKTGVSFLRRFWMLRANRSAVCW